MLSVQNLSMKKKSLSSLQLYKTANSMNLPLGEQCFSSKSPVISTRASRRERERTSDFMTKTPFIPDTHLQEPPTPPPLSGGGHKGYNTEGVADQYTGCKIEHPSSESGHDKYVSIREPPLLPPPVSTVVSGGVFPSIDEGFKSPQVRIGRRPAENDSSCVFFLRYFLIGEFWNSVARGCHFTGVRLCGWQEV